MLKTGKTIWNSGKTVFIFVATNFVETSVGIEQDIKQRKFESGYQKALVNLLYTSNWMRDHHGLVFKPYSIKEAHYNVLRILKGRYPQSASAGEIKDVMLDKSPDLTRLVDKLCQKGWVERQTCPENRRKVNVKISKQGINVLDELNQTVANEQNKLFNGITEKEANQLSDLLDKLRGS